MQSELDFKVIWGFQNLIWLQTFALMVLKVLEDEQDNLGHGSGRTILGFPSSLLHKPFEGREFDTETCFHRSLNAIRVSSKDLSDACY